MISRLIGLANNYKKINNITEQQKSESPENFLAGA
jgi:hypothetical protein